MPFERLVHFTHQFIADKPLLQYVAGKKIVLKTALV